jgi:hypothetical protein
MTTASNNMNEFSAFGNQKIIEPQRFGAQLGDAALSREKAPPKIMKRAAFALRSLIFVAVLLGIWGLMHRLVPVFDGGLLFYFRLVMGTCALAALGLFVWYAVAPRVRDIGILGAATWVVIVLAFLLPETTASWAVLLLYPGYVPSVFAQKT